MKMETYLGNIRIVLTGPEGAFNIGSVARVMKNMGLEELAMVNPAEYKNDEGYRGAVGARDSGKGPYISDIEGCDRGYKPRGRNDEEGGPAQADILQRRGASRTGLSGSS